VIAYRKAK
jgi:antibiotic biosynthesis monooxygenase (ABM) superfamily enzyme